MKEYLMCGAIFVVVAMAGVLVGIAIKAIQAEIRWKKWAKACEQYDPWDSRCLGSRSELDKASIVIRDGKLIKSRYKNFIQ